MRYQEDDANRLEPQIIQGGMGAGVSAWSLARAVSQSGQLGVVSGTALDVILARRLQLGDPTGVYRRALDAFPDSEMASCVWDRYFIPGGKAADAPFIASPVGHVQPKQAALDLLIVGNFVEVFLAKEGHQGFVGINYLEKIQLPTLPSIFGAMLAGVDYVLMGAGIPRTIPGILDSLSEGQPVELALNVCGMDRGDAFVTRFNPAECYQGDLPLLFRPKFLAIVASGTLATMLVRKSTGHVDGFVIEGPTAGGHNAPPRGAMQLNERGEPIYGKRDEVDLKTFRAIGRPFWLAGSYGTPERLVKALAEGAAGIQVGTAFAFCQESGLADPLKHQTVAMSKVGHAKVMTDPVASPTGFPFKVLPMPQSVSEAVHYEQRCRICDLGYLRHAYKKNDGAIGWRCPADKVELYLDKGGKVEDTEGRKCVCNALMANIGLGQVRKDVGQERPMVTCGDEVRNITDFLPAPDADQYSAEDVIRHLLSRTVISESSVAEVESSDSSAPRSTETPPRVAPEFVA